MPTFSNGENGLSVRTKINNAIDRVDGLQTTSSPAFAGLTVNGNITVTGTVDGRDVSTDGTKLDGIEAGATADLTAAEVKTLYESNANTNAFTDAEQALVAGALQASNNLSDLTIPATALTNLGLTATATEINYTDGVTSAIQAQLDGKQPLDAGLTSIAGLTTAADQMIYTTASDTYAVTTLTAAGRAILDDANAAAQLVTLGLTATAAELNTMDGITASTAELNILDGVTATAAELNVLDGVTGLIGWGQTWTDVTESRAYSPSSYQNTTGRPICVSVRTGNNSAMVTAYSFQVSPDNSTWLTIMEGNTSADDNYGMRGSVIVPDGVYYRLVRSGANTAAITGWMELR